MHEIEKKQSGLGMLKERMTLYGPREYWNGYGEKNGHGEGGPPRVWSDDVQEPVMCRGMKKICVWTGKIGNCGRRGS